MPEFNNHEMVSFFYDKKTGLKGFISIHNMNLGEATGGTRYFEYETEEDALRDVLRLSMAMTYKCALAGVPHGGGKAVIIKNKHKPKNEAYLKTYAEKVNLLHGNFTTGEDAGINGKDIEILAKYSKFINCRDSIGGDPSPWAALGVFYSVKPALKAVFGNEEIKGRTFAIKGLGKVGMELLRLLYEEGAEIKAADINKIAVKDALKKFPKIKIVKPEEIHKTQADVYSPCAMGKEFNNKTIRELKCRVICGAANNQLVSPMDGECLHKKNILYIPDYLANAGGLINVVEELNKEGYSRERVIEKIKNIKNTAEKVIEISKKKKRPISETADALAEKIFMQKKKTEDNFKINAREEMSMQIA